MATEKRSMSMSKKKTIVNTASYIVLGLISIIWILPFVFLLLKSFDTGNTGVTYSHQFGASITMFICSQANVTSYNGISIPLSSLYLFVLFKQVCNS